MLCLLLVEHLQADFAYVSLVHFSSHFNVRQRAWIVSKVYPPAFKSRAAFVAHLMPVVAACSPSVYFVSVPVASRLFLNSTYT